VAGAAAVAGVTAVAVSGLGQAPGPSAAAGSSGMAADVPYLSHGTGGATLDAWTVTKGPDGAIEVTVRQLEDAAGLQAALRADGIPIRVAFQVGEPSDSPPLPAGCANVSLSDEANAKLQARILGWPVAPVTGLAPKPPAGPGIAISIYPRQIPRGIGIYLAVQSGSDRQHYGWGLDLVRASRACTG
jgi:hypothetical protein